EEVVEAEDLREHVAARLPEYMVPSAYVQLAAFPLTPNGKLDRRALPAPDDDAYAQREYEAPQGVVEETLARIWCELLGLERVGRNDSFFELGGHSLLAVRMVARLREALGVQPPIQAVFKTRTLALFADLLAERYEDNRSLVRLAGTKQGIPLFCIHTIGDHVDYYQPLANALEDSFTVYGLYPPANWWLPGPNALERLARTHADSIQAQQREGPYRLLGWSAGGQIALAVSIELERRGQVVSYVGLVDTPTRSELKANLAHYWQNMVQRDLLQDGRRSIPQELLENLLRDPENITDLDLEQLLTHSQDIEDGKDLLSLQLAHKRLKAWTHQMRCIVENDLGPINAPLHFYWSKATLSSEPVHKSDWVRLTAHATSTTHEWIDGDHITILEQPFVLELANAITKKALDPSHRRE
ncbi:MAG TPA: thioesterase domain-containing protein, partial [Acidobacteriaceae bacterium]